MIQLSISMQFISILLLDKTLSRATPPDQSEPGSDRNDRTLRIPQSSSVTRTTPSDCLVSYLGHSFRESYSSARKQLVFSTALADWAILQQCPACLVRLNCMISGMDDWWLYSWCFVRCCF